VHEKRHLTSGVRCNSGFAPAQKQSFHRNSAGSCQGKLDEGEEMYLDALSDLVGAYEDEHYAIKPASDADMLRHLMEAKVVT
jgi:hypothetical protein